MFHCPQEPHPHRMSFDEVAAKAQRSDRQLSVLYFLTHLKAFFVEVRPAHSYSVF